MAIAGAIDVSKICRDAALPPMGAPASLDRLRIVVEAWDQRFGPGRRALVADRSLVHALERSDRPAYRRMTLKELQVADDRLLELGKEGWHVLSGDLFVDHRRAHPWIDGNATRFHHWTVQGGDVVVTDRLM